MDPLANLKDIHLPDPVGFWPLALGWWLLIAMLIVFLLLALVGYRKYQAQRARRQAKQALKQADSPQQILTLLKTLCLSYFPRELVAGLHGESLQMFLLQQIKSRHLTEYKQLSDGLLARAHAPDLPVDFTPQLKIAVGFWIRHAVFTIAKQESSQ